MGRKLVFLNILMLVAILVLAQNLVTSWAEFVKEQTPLLPEGPNVSFEEARLPEDLEPISSFLDIAASNLFKENRGQDLSKGLESEGEGPPELNPEPTLTSVITFGEEKTAVLSVSRGQRNRGPREEIKVKLGDDVQGYTVLEIADNRIVLSWQDHQREISLDPGQPQDRKTAPRAGGGPNIIVVGSPGAAVETTTASATEKKSRGVQVGSVGQGAGRGGGGLGGSGRGLQGGRGVGGGSRATGTLGAGGRGTSRGGRQVRPTRN